MLKKLATVSAFVAVGILAHAPVRAAMRTAAYVSVSGVSEGGGFFVSSQATSATTHTVGNTLVACVGWEHDPGNEPTVTVTNDALDTWVDTTAQADIAGVHHFRIFFVKSSNGATNDVVTAHYASGVGASSRSVAVYEFSGMDTTNTLDSTVTNTGIHASWSSGSIPVSQSGTVLVACGRELGGSSWTVGNGDGLTAGSGNAVTYKLGVSAATALTATVDDVNWMGMGASFKPAGGGGGGGASVNPALLNLIRGGGFPRRLVEAR